MGTRADFYLATQKNLVWLGSIAWDGYPSGIPEEILNASDQDTYIDEVTKFIKSIDDGTTPDMGWPWPWETSDTTDWSYIFSHTQQEHKVACVNFDKKDLCWYDSKLDKCVKCGLLTLPFPIMKNDNVTMDIRSGIIGMVKKQ